MGSDGRRGHTGHLLGIAGRSSTSATGGIDPAVNPLGAILAAINSSQRETRELCAELRAAQEEAAEKEAKKLERPYRFQTRSKPSSMIASPTISGMPIYSYRGRLGS